MTKILLTFLAFALTLIALLLYIGGDASLILRSTAVRAPLNFGEVEMKWQFAIILFVVGFIIFVGLWAFITWLLTLPARMREGAGSRRKDKALEAVETALIVGMQGDAKQAKKRSEELTKLIGQGPLSALVSAHIAKTTGADAEIETAYTALLGDDRTEMNGHQGLALHYHDKQNWDRVIDHTAAIYNDNKSARWAFDMLFNAYVKTSQWTEAQDLLNLAESRTHIDRDVAARRHVVLKTAQGQSFLQQEEFDKAYELVVGAAQKSPEFVPIVALSTKLLAERGAHKKAANLIEKAWAVKPHPALVQAMRDVIRTDTQRQQRKQMLNLIKAKPEHRESLILSAEEYLLAEDPTQAWSTLSPLLTDTPSNRLCYLAALIEKALGNPRDATVWLERAALAPHEPDWSDIDPDGEAFAYTSEDWQRLVFSYGEHGGLIHPRLEAGKAQVKVLPALSGAVEAPRDATKPTEALPTSKEADNVESAAALDTTDVASEHEALELNEDKTKDS